MNEAGYMHGEEDGVEDGVERGRDWCRGCNLELGSGWLEERT